MTKLSHVFFGQFCDIFVSFLCCPIAFFCSQGGKGGYTGPCLTKTPVHPCGNVPALYSVSPTSVFWKCFLEPVVIYFVCIHERVHEAHYAQTRSRNCFLEPTVFHSPSSLCLRPWTVWGTPRGYFGVGYLHRWHVATHKYCLHQCLVRRTSLRVYLRLWLVRAHYFLFKFVFFP